MTHPYALRKMRERSGGTGKAPVTLAKVTHDWSKIEKRIIAAESLRLIDEDSQLLPIEAIRQAIGKLSKAARHDVKDMRSCRWIFPLWDELKVEANARNEPAAVETPAEPVVTPTVDTAETPAENYPNPGYTQQGAVIELAQAKPRGAPKGARMVRWKDDERLAVAKAFMKMVADFPDMEKTHALRKAMELSADTVRQRNIVGYSMEKPWLEKLINDLTAEAEREAAELQAQQEREAKAEQKRLAKEQYEREQREAREQAIALERARELEKVAHEAIEGLSIDEMMGHMARKFGRMMVEQMKAGLSDVIKEAITGQAKPADPYAGYPREVIPEAERAKPAPRDHKPRVMICGLLNQQQQEVKKEFASLFSLDFHRGTGEGGSELGASLKNYDVVIQMAGFSGHDREDKFKKYGIKPVRINGTTSAVKRWLRQWAVGEAVRMSA